MNGFIRAIRAIAVPALLLVGLGGAETVETIESPYEAAERGNQAFSEARYSDAATYYQAALLDLPEAPELHYNLGNAQFKLHDMGQALVSYLAALETTDRGMAAQTHFNLGNVQYQMALNAMRTFRDAVTPIREAMRSYREALSMDPGFADAMYNLELADKFHEEMKRQRMFAVTGPGANEEVETQNESNQLDPRITGERPTEEQVDQSTEGAEDQTGEAQQGPQMSDSSEQQTQSQPNGSQREMSAQEAEEMVEMVRGRNEAAEAMRQQWRQARMREADVARPW